MRSDHRNFRDETEANAEAVDRIIQRLGYEKGELDVQALLSHLPSPAPHSATHLRNRLLLKERGSPRASWIPVGAFVVATMLGFVVFWSTTETPSMEPIAHQNDSPDSPVSVPETTVERVETPRLAVGS